MRRILPLLVLLLLTAGVDAQLARNGAYFELGGSGVAPTANYERQVREQWYARVGLVVVTGTSTSDDGEEESDTTVVVPLTASWVSHPTSNHHFELGGGITFAGGERQEFFDDVGDEEDDENFSTLIATGIIGYRYQKPGRGFQFRAALTPLAGGGDFAPWAGVSFGYAW